LKAVIVESLAFPESFAMIDPVAELSSLTEILRFPAGLAKNPDNEQVALNPAAAEAIRLESMTVVPSQSFMLKAAAPAVSITVTVPLAYQVPNVP
jgi:hypothetical protein